MPSFASETVVKLWHDQIHHLSDNPLHQIAMRLLTTVKPSASSQFLQVRDLYLQYSLPHPLVLLRNPIPKAKFKVLTKQAVICYWQERLRADAASLVSLSFFHPCFMSVTKPHPIWMTASSNPYEVNKAVVQARMPPSPLFWKKSEGRYHSHSHTSPLILQQKKKTLRFLLLILQRELLH